MTIPVTVVVPGDLHITHAGLPNLTTAWWAVEEVNDLIRPDFVQFIGDNVQDGTTLQYGLFRELTARLTVPWYALVGDHDAPGDPSAAAFREHVGNATGSMSLGGFRFIRLNTQEARPVGISTTQLDWFRAEVDGGHAAGEKPVVFQHNYPYQIWEDFAGPGIDVWREIVQTRRIQAILCGHTHYWQTANDGRNVFVATRSIGDQEGGPAGYTVAVFHGEDFAVTYRTFEDAGPLVLVTHPRDALLATGPTHIVRGRDEVRARVWSAAPLKRVQFQIDDGPASPMTPNNNGLWCSPLPGDQLAKGCHRLVVQAESKAGASEQRIEFAVDPTGRYTAIPGVRPVVTTTAFC